MRENSEPSVRKSAQWETLEERFAHLPAFLTSRCEPIYEHRVPWYSGWRLFWRWWNGYNHWCEACVVCSDVWMMPTSSKVFNRSQNNLSSTNDLSDVGKKVRFKKQNNIMFYSVILVFGVLLKEIKVWSVRIRTTYGRWWYAYLPQPLASLHLEQVLLCVSARQVAMLAAGGAALLQQ